MKILKLVATLLIFFRFSSVPAQTYPNISPGLGWYGDIAFQDSILWVGGVGVIYGVDPISGNILDTINTNISDAIDGIVYAQGFLWVTHDYSTQIQKIDPVTRTIFGLYNVSSSALAIHGIEFFNDNFYLNFIFNGIDDSTFVYDTLFNIIAKYPNHAEFAHAIVCDGNNFWITVNHLGPNPAKLYKYDLNFFLIDSFPIPGGNYPNGLALNEKSRCLWLANTDSLKIYEMCELPLFVNVVLPSAFIKLFPNPAVSFLTISSSSTILNIEIYTSMGKLLSGIKFPDKNELQIQIDDFPGPFLLLLIYTRDGYFVRKVVTESDF